MSEADLVAEIKRQVDLRVMEGDAFTGEIERLREANAFLISAIRSGEPVFMGHCEGCDKALSALHSEEKE